MVEVEIAHNGDCPRVTDDRFLAMIAEDVDVADTTPAEALMGTVRYMPELGTLQIVETMACRWEGRPDEKVEFPAMIAPEIDGIRRAAR